MVKKTPSGADRSERIKEEILQAKKVAGLQPPTAVPLGDTFRSETLTRPDGAVSFELHHAGLVRGAADADFAGGHGLKIDDRIAKLVGAKLAVSPEAMLDDAERAIDRLKGPEGARLASQLSEQLNLATALNAEDPRLETIRAKLDAVRFGDVDYSKADQDQPGGGQRVRED